MIQAELMTEASNGQPQRTVDGVRTHASSAGGGGRATGYPLRYYHPSTGLIVCDQ